MVDVGTSIDGYFGIELNTIEDINICSAISIFGAEIDELYIHNQLEDIYCDIYLKLININNNELTIEFY